MLIPFGNKRNDIGKVIDISFLKYLKVGFMFLSLLFLIWATNLMMTLSNNLVQLTQFNTFFTMLFRILIVFAYPAFVVMVIIMLLMMFDDWKVGQLLTRGIGRG